MKTLLVSRQTPNKPGFEDPLERVEYTRKMLNTNGQSLYRTSEVRPGFGSYQRSFKRNSAAEKFYADEGSKS